MTIEICEHCITVVQAWMYQSDQ